MVLTKKEAYHPVAGLMPSPLEEVPEELGWYHEEWATPYMAAVARVIFRRKEDNKVYHPVVGLMPSPLEEVRNNREYHPVVGLMPSPLEEVPQPWPMPNSGTAEYYAGLGAELKAAEWLKENRILVIVVIVALVLLFFFLRKGRR